MLLANLKVTVQKITDALVELKTDQGFAIAIPRYIMPEVKTGQTIYLAADAKPLVSNGEHAKNVLNEIIKE